MDVLVSIGVIAILIALLLPSLGRVQESARQAVCASNMRQSGIGVQLYANRFDDHIPPSFFLDRDNAATRNLPEAVAQRYMVLIHLRLTNYMGSEATGMWDGLGKLYEEDIPPAAAIFYCPSHKGEHTFERYAMQISQAYGEIHSNYQYRGKGPDGRRRLDQLVGSVALVADSMFGEDSFNHDAGFNVLRVDNSVGWFPDNGGEIAERLASTAFEDDDALPQVWTWFDKGAVDLED